jgi:hypothetical protein
MYLNKMRRFGKSLAWAVALAGAAATAEATDCVTPQGEGRVSLDCRAVPLGQVLRALSAVTPIDTRLIDSGAQAASIYVAAADVSVAQALRASLDAAGISFVLFEGDGTDLKVYASGHSSASSATRTASVRPGPVPDSQEFIPDEIPEVEEVPVHDVKEAAATGSATGSASGKDAGAMGSASPAFGSPPSMADPLRASQDSGLAGRQGPAATMEEILARSNPSGAVPGANGPPAEKQVYSTMEEILARGAPKQPQ